MQARDVKSLKMVAAIVETILALPFIGGLIVIGTAWLTLVIVLALHIAILAVTSSNKSKKTAPIIGIITNALAWIPVVGWLLHLVTAILYWVDIAGKKA